MYEKELLEFFLTEADEHIVHLEKGFLELEQNPSDTSGIHELFRTAHTLKGAAALVKLNILSGIAHRMEDALEAIRDAQITITKEIVDWLLHSLDSIKFLVSETANGRQEKAELLDEISNSLPLSVLETLGDNLETSKDILMDEPADSAEYEETAAGNSEEDRREPFADAGTEITAQASDEYIMPKTEASDKADAAAGEEIAPEPFAAFESTETEMPAQVEYAVQETEAAGEEVAQEPFAASESIETEMPAQDEYAVQEAVAAAQADAAAGEEAAREPFAASEGTETGIPAQDEYAVPETEYEPVHEEGPEKRKVMAVQGEDLDTVSPFVKVHINRLDKMMGLVGELTILKNFFISETEGVSHLRSEIEYACQRLIKEIDDFDSRYAHSAPEKVSFVDALLEEFRELEFDRYDGINLFANSIKEIMSDVNVAIKSISAFFNQFSTHTNRLDKLNMEFRDIISASRMMETGRLFQRFTRIVRDLSDQSGKRVKFVVAGGHTRIDRILYERLFTPLLHLVRNAFSHGIEPPEERRSNGKSEEGTIILSARREGNSVVIDVEDNGRGIELKKVYQKAAKMKIIRNGENVSESRLHNILFMPGFSTHDGIDMTSGRGVGLDAVRQTISEINGTISITSTEGKGTTFRITLPLTLIVVNTVKFRAGGLDFSVPSSLIHELMDVDVTEYSNNNETIKLRDEEIPLKDLCTLLKLQPERTGKRIPVIVFNLMSGQGTGLVVDEITGQEDTVIKPLGGFLEGLRCYSGFSISADARLSPVINPIGLLEARIDQVETLQEQTAEDIKKNILVVDDSLSVRKFAGMLLEQNGYNVLTAANGLEALTAVDENQIDLILTDLEMPVMHGYELLRELKRREISDVIPAIVLTSRSNEKHKEKAKQLGAKDYIVKPFQEASLVQTIKKYLKAGIVIPAE